MINRNFVEDILLDMGIPVKLMGFEYIIDAIEVFDRRGERIAIVNELYSEIAQKRNTTGSKVERAIRHALAVTREFPRDMELVEKYIGYEKIGNASSLISLYKHVKREMDESEQKEHESEEKQKNVSELFPYEDSIRNIVRDEIFNILKNGIGGIDGERVLRKL